MRRIAVVSAGRADRGHLAPLLTELGEQAVLLDLDVLSEEIQSPLDTPVGMARAAARTLGYLAGRYAEIKPDIVVVFGDRYEQLAAAHAATLAALPIAHIHGGETTVGAYDNQMRHAITKLAHLHFVSHQRHGSRVYRMGEEKWRIHVTGAPGLDRIPATPAHTREDLARRFGLPLDKPWLLVCLHPCTLETEDTAATCDALIEALSEFDAAFVITSPGPDVSYHAIKERMFRFEQTDARAKIIAPTDAEYLSLMAHAECMVGNSSSGIIEAPTLRLPVVNIGRRQEGRMRGDNVVSVKAHRDVIAHFIRYCVDGCLKCIGHNPYGDGHAAPRIATVLREVAIDRKLVEKR